VDALVQMSDAVRHDLKEFQTMTARLRRMPMVLSTLREAGKG
jgi:hypothetical protein